MTDPPPTIDGGRVLWWSWSGEEPFGKLSGAEPDARDIFDSRSAVTTILE